MKTAKLKRARTIAAVIAELDAERCNRVYASCYPFATETEWIADHIRKNYFAELKAEGCNEMQTATGEWVTPQKQPRSIAPRKTARREYQRRHGRTMARRIGS